MPVPDEPPRLGPLRGPGSLSERTLVRGGPAGGTPLPVDARTVWTRSDPPEDARRAAKHQLVEQIRLLVESIALLDVQLTEPLAPPMHLLADGELTRG